MELGPAVARARLGGIFDRSATLPFAGGVEREPDGAVFGYRQARRAVISASGVDLLEASPERRRRQLRLFEHLLVGLETPFQLLVTSRPGEARELSAREAMYLESRARERPFYERRTYIILSESDAGAGSGLDQVWSRAQRNWRRPGPARAADLLRRARAVAEVLGAMGLRPQVLEGEALEQFLRLHLPSVLRWISLCAWREHASSLQLDRRLHRSYFLDAYPGVELAGGWL